MLVPSSSLRTFLEESSKRYHNQLTDDARDYLMGPERKLTEETINHFRYGVVKDPGPGHEKYQGMLTIPYLTPSGSVVSIRFRNLSGHGPKYLSVAGEVSRLYNTADLERGRPGICITEGEFDTAIAWQCDMHCIGVPGVDHWKPLFARLLDQYDSVFVLSDDDEPGQRFAEMVARDCDNARNIPMTGGDVTTFYLEHGKDALRRKVRVR